MIGRSNTFFLPALAVWAGGLGWVLSLDDPRLRYLPFLGGWLLLVLGQAGLVWTRPHGRRLAAAIVVLVLGRVWAWSLTPAFSDDVFRYVYEGRLALWAGPLFPYLHPPAAGPELGVPAALLDRWWLRINHAELATVYPVGALGLFVAGAGLGQVAFGATLGALKLLFLGADLALWRALHLRDPRAGLVWGASPLVILEGAREGHVDVVAALGLGLGALALLRGRDPSGGPGARPGRAWTAFMGAGLVKMNGFVLTPLLARIDPRGSWRLLPGLLLLALPFVLTAGDDSGLGAYATRWRAGDGAFSVLLVAAEGVLGGDWARFELGGQVLTITRHQLARALTGGLFAALYGLMLVRPRAWLGGTGALQPADGVPLAGSLFTFLLLLAPTLHPWYLLWLVPFVALGPFPGRGAAVWLISSAALLHHPGWRELVTGHWVEWESLRFAVHAPAWALLIVGRLRPFFDGPRFRRSLAVLGVGGLLGGCGAEAPEPTYWDHDAWSVGLWAEDPWLDHAPEDPGCVAPVFGIGGEASEERFLDVVTGACGFFSGRQPLGRALRAGDRLELTYFYSDLVVPPPA
ncbi:MAG: hypothetical protein AAFU79_19260, partial [Myxococcota bacterium]